METNSTDRHYARSERATICVLTLYCVAAGIIAFTYLFVCFSALGGASELRQQGTDSLTLLQLVVIVGVLGAVLRGVESLVTDVGRGSFFSRWSLAILMRPLEGAIVAAVVYFAFAWLLGGLINSFGFLAIAGVSGMFSHNAAGCLRNTCGRLVGASRGGQSQNGAGETVGKS